MSENLSATPQTEEREMSPAEWRRTLAERFAEMRIPFTPSIPGPQGLRLDFCFGVRLTTPPTPVSRRYEVSLQDRDSGLLLARDTIGADEYYVSCRKSFVRWGIQIKDADTGERIWQYFYDAKDKPVFFRFAVDTLGDTLAWLRCVLEFAKREKCKPFVRLADYIRPLLEPANPDVNFVTYDDCKTLSSYAAYTIAVFKKDGRHFYTAADYRTVPLHHVPAYILNIPPSLCEEPPPVYVPDVPKEKAQDKSIPEIPSGRYVAIGAKASGGVKLWHYPEGWHKVGSFLLENGLAPVAIDKKNVISCRFYTQGLPATFIDLTGDSPLVHRAAQIANAEFYIGLGSGLSWLAWCLRKPVVLIGGFSEPWEEFPTPYRVRNPHLCHGCFNDASIVFDNHDFFWCPRHANTDRHWECSVGITPKMVIDAIKSIPEFQKGKKEA